MIVNLSLLTWRKKTPKGFLENIFKSELKGDQPIPKLKLGIHADTKVFLSAIS